MLTPIKELQFEFIEAVDGRELVWAEIKRLFDTNLSDSRYGRELSAAEIACTLSHYKCYKTILDQGLEYALILEDAILIVGDTDIIESIEFFIKKPEPIVSQIIGHFIAHKV